MEYKRIFQESRPSCQDQGRWFQWIGPRCMAPYHRGPWSRGRFPSSPVASCWWWSPCWCSCPGTEPSGWRGSTGSPLKGNSWCVRIFCWEGVYLFVLQSTGHHWPHFNRTIELLIDLQYIVKQQRFHAGTLAVTFFQISFFAAFSLPSTTRTPFFFTAVARRCNNNPRPPTAATAPTVRAAAPKFEPREEGQLLHSRKWRFECITSATFLHWEEFL